MNTELLKDQAWALFVKLNKIVETEYVGWFARRRPSVRKTRIVHARANAYIRFLRRQQRHMQVR